MGQSLYRIYLWMALLNIPALPTDEYLKLVHRGQSPVYAKIRNDTFRTLATDTLFKRRVTDASLTRSKMRRKPSSRVNRLQFSLRRRQMSLPSTCKE